MLALDRNENRDGVSENETDFEHTALVMPMRKHGQYQNTTIALLLLRVLCVFVVAILTGACDSQKQQNDFVDDAGLPPSGFAETDADGIILKDDEDDWRTAPIYFGKVRIDPAYPNPSFGQFITVPVSIQEFNGVQGGIVLRAEDGNGALRLIDELLNTNQPGSYVLRFSPAVLGRTGLIRVFLFDRLGELISYGDVSIR